MAALFLLHSFLWTITISLEEQERVLRRLAGRKDAGGGADPAISRDAGLVTDAGESARRNCGARTAGAGACRFR